MCVCDGGGDVARCMGGKENLIIYFVIKMLCKSFLFSLLRMCVCVFVFLNLTFLPTQCIQYADTSNNINKFHPNKKRKYFY